MLRNTRSKLKADFHCCVFHTYVYARKTQSFTCVYVRTKNATVEISLYAYNIPLEVMTKF
jgi:dihydrodipicolinate synthase/N-acetylneuraminate lyase